MMHFLRPLFALLIFINLCTAETYEIESFQDDYAYGVGGFGFLEGCQPNRFTCEFDLAGTIEIESPLGLKDLRIRSANITLVGNEDVPDRPPLATSAGVARFLTGLRLALVAENQNSWTYRQAFNFDRELTVTIGPDQMSISGGFDERLVDGDSALFDVIANRVVEELGDYNNNGVLDVGDIDQMTLAINDGSNDEIYDLDGNGVVDSTDRRVWVEDLFKTYFGDSNLDGEFNSGDFVTVFQHGEFEDQVDENSTWEEGDWSGDLDFTSNDFVTAFLSEGFELGPRVATASVPEPASGVMFMIAVLVFSCAARRRKVGSRSWCD